MRLGIAQVQAGSQCLDFSFGQGPERGAGSHQRKHPGDLKNSHAINQIDFYKEIIRKQR